MLRSVEFEEVGKFELLGRFFERLGEVLVVLEYLRLCRELYRGDCDWGRLNQSRDEQARECARYVGQERID